MLMRRTRSRASPRRTGSPSLQQPLLRCVLVVLTIALVIITSAIGQNTARAQERPQVPADELTVAMVELAPFVINDNGAPDGFYADIWHELSEDLGVRYDVLWVDSFADLLPALEDGRAQVAVAPLAATASRVTNYDFSSAVVEAGPHLAVSERLDGRPSIIRAMVDTRVLSVFAFAVVGLLLLAHVIWWLERDRDGQDGDFDRSYLRGIWDGFWWATVTTTTVGYGDKAPKSFGGRLVALIAMMMSLVLVGALVTQATTVMADTLTETDYATVDDIDVPVGVVGGTSFEDFLVANGKAVRTYDTVEDLLGAVDAGAVDVVMANRFTLSTEAEEFDLRVVERPLYAEFETFGMAQGSPWRAPINAALADMHFSGEIAKIVDRGLTER